MESRCHARAPPRRERRT